MKTKLTLILIFLIITLIMNGCSFKITDDKTSNSQSNSNPSETIMPTQAQESVATPTPTIKLIPTVTPIPTAIPTPTMKPMPTNSIPTNVDGTKPDPSSYDKIASSILKNMTLEEKIGQLFFVRCRSDYADTDIKTYHLGGYILFGVDFEDKTKKELINNIQDYQDSSKIPLLIGVDEEGGSVIRVSKYPAFRSVPFKSPQDLYKMGGFDLIRGDTIEKAKLLKSLGINVNLAPVCDVSTNPKDFIYNRTFGKDAKATSDYVTTVVKEMNSQGIGSTLKHFPGYGNNVDTHTGIAIDDRSYNSFVKTDFLPFEAGIEAGAGSILVSHNIVKSMDKNYPASLSVAVHNILRNDLGFEGVIMTDDLSMDAILQYTNDKEAAVLAIEAGNDLIIASNFDIQIPAVIEAVKDNTLTEARIDESVMRILIWKLSMGIIS
ncbi:MAG: beta-hexosaminidase [Herbinix sp.]|jgi:beta-N-acetylhexosaminidase|nr:beta-hexosaminidase [Herbinix sp.]